MNKFAKKLILKNLKSKSPVLDLGRCGLDGTEKELEKLQECEHLKVLIFSNVWFEFEDGFTQRISQNRGKHNKLIKIPEYLPSKLSALILSGDWDYIWEISNYQVLTKLKHLKKLNLWYNLIAQNTTFLQNLKSLEYLSLNLNQIKDISFLQDLTSLQYLDLSENLIQDISPLENLVNLVNLYLWANDIQDISPLKTLKRLERLDLSSNKIQDITVLKKLTNLIQLNTNLDMLPFPPIYYVSLKTKSGRLGDYTHLPELPKVEKIWQLMITDDEENTKLAQQLAKGQGWTEEEFEMYKSLP